MSSTHARVIGGFRLSFVYSSVVTQASTQASHSVRLETTVCHVSKFFSFLPIFHIWSCSCRRFYFLFLMPWNYYVQVQCLHDVINIMFKVDIPIYNKDNWSRLLVPMLFLYFLCSSYLSPFLKMHKSLTFGRQLKFVFQGQLVYMCAVCHCCSGFSGLFSLDT